MHIDRARRLFLALGAGVGFANGVLFTALMVYFITVVRMTPLQLVLVGTVLEASVIVFQVPTGVFADAISRKVSILIGLLLAAVSAAIMAMFPSFQAIIAAQVVWGLAFSFGDGATEAWVAGEASDKDLARLFLRRGQASQIGYLVGLPLAMLLGSFDLRIPIWLDAIWMVGLAALVAIAMTENAPVSEAAIGAGRMLETTVRGWRVLRAQPALIALLGVALFYGMASEGIDRLGDAHLLRDLGVGSLKPFSPVVWIGLLDLAIVVLAIGAAELLRRWKSASHSPDAVLRTVLALNALQVVAMAVFALASSLVVAVVVFLAIAVARRLARPLYNAWVIEITDPAVRATILSVGGQADAIGQVVGGPPIGLLGTLVSIPAALLGSAACLLPALPLIGLARGSRRRTEDQAGVPAVTPEP